MASAEKASGAAGTAPASPSPLTGNEGTARPPHGAARWIKLLMAAAPLALAIAAFMAGSLWIPLLPRPVLRALTEILLRSVLVIYGTVVLASLVGTPLLGWLIARSGRSWRRRPFLLRGFLICASCLVSLFMVELGSAGWRAWIHRFPALPADLPRATPGEYRIVVLGGSSALGEPYRPWLSVGQIVAWRLGQAMPDRRVECEILAWLGDSLEEQHRKLAGIKVRPDMVIIYSGHNEFAKRYEEEREGGTEEDAGIWLVDRAFEASLRSPFCRLVYEALSRNRLDSPPSLARRHQLIDPPQCSRSEWTEIVEDFQTRLESIVRYCEQLGAVTILIVPPANESGYAPSRSTLPNSVPAAERDRLARAFREARDLETSDPVASERALEAIIARHPGFAEAHFRLARLLEKRGRPRDAASHYLAALDHDGLPIRCPEPLRMAIGDAARRHPGAIFIDARKELAAASPTGLLGDSVIQDTHHPTLRGYVALGSAVLRELDRRRILGNARLTGLPLDPAACARHFGMDAAKWATVCERASEHYRRVAGYRYDPAERMEKSRRYAEAARRLRAGEAPGAVNLPGVTDPPAPARPLSH